MLGGILLILPLLLATTILLEDYRAGEELVVWRPFLTEYSSALVALMLIPGVLYIDRQFPIANRNWYWRFLLHLPLSILFSILHISGMFALRKLIYDLMGEDFSMDPLPWVFLYEYRKDLGTYIALLMAIYAYREILRLRLGEAQLVRKEDTSNEKILVSKRGVYHFIEPEEIHWIESAGNYVELHVGGETYMLRSTMKEIEKRLGTRHFVRIHRSTLVNRREIKSIMVGPSGGRKLTLNRHDEVFSVSRNFKHNLTIQ